MTRPAPPMPLRFTAPSLPMALAAALLAAGCANLAPPYQAPAPAVPATLDGATTAPAQASDIGNVPWESFITDPRLRGVVAQSLEANRDLRVAALAIERARAQYGVSRADLFPTLNATGAGTRSRTADDLTAAGRSNTSAQYSAQIGFASYEIDFFGRVRNLNDAALQEFLRVGENARSVRLSLIADVAGAWLTLDADARRLLLARETLRTREQSLSLAQRSYEQGATSGLTLTQTQTTVDSARADIATTTAQLAKDRNALHLLAGGPVADALLPPVALEALAPPPPPAAPSQAQAPAQGGAPSPSGADRAGSPDPARWQRAPARVAPLLAVPASLPSSTLLRRPDVQAAERSLQGSFASIGAARAAFFPSITLTTSVGTASNELSGLFGAGNGTWSFAPQIRLPIFDAGRNQANLRIAEVARDTAVAQYDKAVQTAFREVADALAERATLQDRVQAQQSLVSTSQRALDLTLARWRLGADSYLAVLDAQRSLYSAQLGLIAVQLAEQSNGVTLYKVLGGG
ncbi:efflux transporter outer membrane subunit [Paracidovorax konjaci]|uniref:Efflux transporter, outer membrane factor (OMF) lipoprotein, NodT family n=1 Tax=Paracidovorax konjaci TaxID=32040 RepID=A0A1I1Y490_9BURK|nr:efflux transporter outer membrane subunit [Paracidovorax konjaci]SFE12650.1 efflux transporter, outer membrane factor (OMF) lipoprotein, NodT family [Paracidovorax konjaci]